MVTKTAEIRTGRKAIVDGKLVDGRKVEYKYDDWDEMQGDIAFMNRKGWEQVTTQYGTNCWYVHYQTKNVK